MGFFSRLLSLFGFARIPQRQSSVPRVVTLEQYWQGRDQRFASELNGEIRDNASELLQRVNLLLSDLNVVSVKVTSGWRPRLINKQIGGAPRSYHITGKAIDLRDNGSQEFASLIIQNKQLLHKYQLWIENPRYTRGKNTNWVHLDMGTRSERDLRMFNP